MKLYKSSSQIEGENVPRDKYDAYGTKCIPYSRTRYDEHDNPLPKLLTLVHYFEDIGPPNDSLELSKDYNNV